MIFNNATDLKLGTTSVSYAYLGSTLVWSRISPTPSPASFQLDVPTLRTLNGYSTGAPIYVYEDDLNISVRGPIMHCASNTGTASYYTLYTLSDAYMLATDCVLTFKNATYTRISFKTQTSSQGQGLSGFICSSGSLTYDSTTDEYVWTGNSDNVSIDMNGNALSFYYICFTVTEYNPIVTVDDFVSMNSLSTGVQQDGTFDLVSDSTLTLTTANYSPNGLWVYSSPSMIDIPASSTGVTTISSTLGNITKIVFDIAVLGFGDNLTFSNGSYVTDTTNNTITWTGSTNSLNITNTGTTSLEWSQLKIYYNS